MENKIYTNTIPKEVEIAIIIIIVVTLLLLLYTYKTNITGISAWGVFANIVNIYQGQNNAGVPIDVNFFPPPSPHFVMRESKYKEIETANYSCQNKHAWWERMIVIHGIGGMGKSEIAKVFVSKNSSKYDYVYWIDAETETSVFQSFKSLARKLNVPFKGISDCSVVYQRLSKIYKSGLLIFDGAQRLQTSKGIHGIKDYLPTQPNISVPTFLITTTQGGPAWVSLEFNIRTIDVDVLERTEAVQLLKKCMGIENQIIPRTFETSINSIANELSGYPLALTLIGSTMAARSSVISFDDMEENIQNYMEDLQRTSLEELSQESKYMAQLKLIYSKTITNMVVEHHAPTALKILKILACLNFNNVPIAVIEYICSTNTNLEQRRVSDASFRIRHGLKLLCRYSFIKIWEKHANGDTHDVITIHKMIQKTAREELLKQQEDKETRLETFRTFDMPDTESLGMHVVCKIKSSILANVLQIDPVAAERMSQLPICRWKSYDPTKVNDIKGELCQIHEPGSSSTVHYQDSVWHFRIEQDCNNITELKIIGDIKFAPTLINQSLGVAFSVDLIIRNPEVTSESRPKVGADIQLLELFQIRWETSEASDSDIQTCTVSGKAIGSDNIQINVVQSGPFNDMVYKLKHRFVNVNFDDSNYVINIRFPETPAT